jgi:hypothetical protein
LLESKAQKSMLTLAAVDIVEPNRSFMYAHEHIGQDRTATSGVRSQQHAAVRATVAGKAAAVVCDIVFDFYDRQTETRDGKKVSSRENKFNRSQDSLLPFDR